MKAELPVGRARRRTNHRRHRTGRKREKSGRNGNTDERDVSFPPGELCALRALCEISRYPFSGAHEMNTAANNLAGQRAVKPR